MKNFIKKIFKTFWSFIGWLGTKMAPIIAVFATLNGFVYMYDVVIKGPTIKNIVITVISFMMMSYFTRLTIKESVKELFKEIAEQKEEMEQLEKKILEELEKEENKSKE